MAAHGQDKVYVAITKVSKNNHLRSGPAFAYLLANLVNVVIHFGDSQADVEHQWWC